MSKDAYTNDLGGVYRGSFRVQLSGALNSCTPNRRTELQSSVWISSLNFLVWWPKHPRMYIHSMIMELCLMKKWGVSTLKFIISKENVFGIRQVDVKMLFLVYFIPPYEIRLEVYTLRVFKISLLFIYIYYYSSTC